MAGLNLVRAATVPDESQEETCKITEFNTIRSKIDAYCGLCCEGCEYKGSMNCSGCRSVYPHYSFATLYADCRRPNAACAEELQLDGCYDCPRPADCPKGYLGADDGYMAKGAAVFIAKHGKGACADMLARAGDSRSMIHTETHRAGEITWGILPYVPWQCEKEKGDHYV